MIKSLFKKLFKKQKPSLLAQNIVWFTYCGWLDQLQAFGQLDKQLWHGKSENL